MNSYLFAVIYILLVEHVRYLFKSKPSTLKDAIAFYLIIIYNKYINYSQAHVVFIPSTELIFPHS